MTDRAFLEFNSRGHLDLLLYLLQHDDSQCIYYGVSKTLKKIKNKLFSRDVNLLKWAFVMLQKTSISSNCCSFEPSVHQRILKIIIRNNRNN